MNKDLSWLETKVREAVLGLLSHGHAFGVPELQQALATDQNLENRAHHQDLSRLLKKICAPDVLRSFGYRRQYTREQTKQGVMSALLFVPAASAFAGGARSSQLPTQTPPIKPMAYLDLSRSEHRRLDRQTNVLIQHLSSNPNWLLKTGRLLQAARNVVGTQSFRRYLERELGMSFSKARRLMRAAEVFGDEQHLESLKLVNTSVIYKLSELSFPKPLREAVLKQGGLIIDGEPRHLAQLRAQDLNLAKQQYLSRQDACRRVQSEHDRTDDAVLKKLLRTRLETLSQGSAIQVSTPALEQSTLEAMTKSLERIERWTQQRTSSEIPDSIKMKLRELLEQMEAE